MGMVWCVLNWWSRWGGIGFWSRKGMGVGAGFASDDSDWEGDCRIGVVWICFR